MVLILSVDVILKIFGYRLNRFVYKQKIKPFSRFLLFQPFLLFSLSPFSRLLLYLPTSFACCCLSKQNPQIVDTTSAAQPTKPSEPGAPTNPQSPVHSQPQIGGTSSQPIHSLALLSSLFSSNPHSNQQRLFLFLFYMWAMILRPGPERTIRPMVELWPVSTVSTVPSFFKSGTIDL